MLFDIYVLFFEDKKFGTRTSGAVFVAGATLESVAAEAEAEGVAAVVTAARHTRPEPGQCHYACVS